MFMCCMKWSSVINLIYSGQLLFSHTLLYKTAIITNVALAINYDLKVVIYDCKTFIVQVPEGAVPPLSRNGI